MPENNEPNINEHNPIEIPPVSVPARAAQDDRFKLSKREIGLIILTVIALALAGFYTWKLSERKQKESQSINSFAECVAAGNPVMESYPEQCAANGRTFTNPDQNVEVLEDNRVTVSSANSSFSITFPGGWKINRLMDMDAFIAFEQRSEDSSMKAAISDIDSYGGDGGVVLHIVLSEDASSEDIGEPRGEVAEYTLVNGSKENPIIGKRYFYEYPEDTEQGYPDSRLKGEKEYYYIFDTGEGKILAISYNVFAEDPRNLIREVESIIDSIILN